MLLSWLSTWQLRLIWCALCCHLLLLQCCPAPAGAAPLFVLFLDGLRWDYTLKSDLPNFSNMRRQGASVIPLRPVYPSLCVPNIYSIFTGLYPHEHGLVGNENYDPLRGVTFNMASPDLMSRLEAGEALWDSLAKRGGRSLLYYLPGCTDAVPACARPYRSLAPLAEVRDALVEGADAIRGGYADLVVLYVDLLDWSGHRYGPESAISRRRLLRQADVLVGMAAKRVVDQSGGSGGHLLVVGDHGMAAIDEHRKATLQQFAMFSDVDRVSHVGAAVGVWPKSGQGYRLSEMMNAMQQHSDQHVEVLTEAQLIRRFYPRSAANATAAAAAASMSASAAAGRQPPVSPRLPPFSMLVAPGHFMETFDRHYPSYSSGPARGWHGYDPAEPSMHTAALLLGPRAQRSVRLNATELGAESLDLYPLLWTLLGLPDSDSATSGGWASRARPELLRDRLLLKLPKRKRKVDGLLLAINPKAPPVAALAKEALLISAASPSGAAAVPSPLMPLRLLLLLLLTYSFQYM